MEWQLRNYEQSPYYNYPTSGYETGINLDDVISPEAPFMNIFNEDLFLETKELTIKDVWDGTTFLDSPYVYDSILEQIASEQEISTTAAIVTDENISSTMDNEPDNAILSNAFVNVLSVTSLSLSYFML